MTESCGVTARIVSEGKTLAMTRKALVDVMIHVPTFLEEYKKHKSEGGMRTQLERELVHIACVVDLPARIVSQ